MERAKRTQGVVLFSVLMAALLAAYWPALGGGVLMDDDVLISGNANLRSFAGLVNTWTNVKANQDFYPLTITSWWVERQVLGRWSLTGHHVVNVLLHGVNAALVYVVMRRMRISAGVAAVTAALFAMHPIQAESVAWMSQRKNTLSGLLYLLSGLWFLRACPGEEEREGSGVRGGIRWGAYGVSLAVFVLAMLAKPVTMTLAGTVALMALVRDGRWSARAVRMSAAYVMLCLPMAVLTMMVQREVVIGSVEELVGMGVVERGLVAMNVPWFYLWKAVWPTGFCFSYPKWEVNVSQGWWAAGACALVVLVLVCAGWGLLGRGRGRWIPVAVLGMYLVTLAPGSGVVPIYWHIFYYVADHVAYLAVIPVLGVAAAAARRAGEWMWRGGGVVLGVVAAGVLGVITHGQAKLYRDAETLWDATLRVNGRAIVAYTNLGVIAERKGEPGIAEVLYRRALSIEPRFAAARANLGTVLYAQRRFEEAVKELRASLAVDEANAAARENLVLALSMGGRHDEAIKEGRAVVAGREGKGMSHYVLGTALVNGGELEEAVLELRRAMAIEPQRQDAAVNLGLAYYLIGARRIETGELEAAAAEFAEAGKLRPDDAEIFRALAAVLGRLGRFEEAAGAARRVTELDEGSAEAWCNLGVALVQMKDEAGARAAWEQAVKVDAESEAGKRSREYLLRLEREGEDVGAGAATKGNDG